MNWSRLAFVLAVVGTLLHCSGKAQSGGSPSGEDPDGSGGGMQSGTGGYDDRWDEPLTITAVTCADVTPEQPFPQYCYSEDSWRRISGIEDAAMGGAVQCPSPEDLLPERPTALSVCLTNVIELCGTGVARDDSAINAGWSCCYPAVMQNVPCD